MRHPNKDRITAPALAVFMALVALLAALNPLAGQDSPPSVIEPQTFPLRVDTVESPEVLRIFTQCGQLSRPITTVEPRAVTSTTFRVVDLCDRGFLVLASESWYATVPMAALIRHDRAGTLGGVLLCIKNHIRSAMLVYEAPPIPLSCEMAGVPGWTP